MAADDGRSEGGLREGLLRVPGSILGAIHEGTGKWGRDRDWPDRTHGCVFFAGDGPDPGHQVADRRGLQELPALQVHSGDPLREGPGVRVGSSPALRLRNPLHLVMLGNVLGNGLASNLAE